MPPHPPRPLPSSPFELVILLLCLLCAIYEKYVQKLLIHDRNCLIINQFSLILAFLMQQTAPENRDAGSSLLFYEASKATCARVGGSIANVWDGGSPFCAFRRVCARVCTCVHLLMGNEHGSLSRHNLYIHASI